MHQRARGHEVEPKNSHLFMSKNKKKQNKGERRNWGESCTNVQEDTRQSAVTPIFYTQQQKEITIREYRGFIRNIMRRYVRISSFFVQNAEKKREMCA